MNTMYHDLGQVEKNHACRMTLLNKTYILEVLLLIPGLAYSSLTQNFFSNVADGTGAARVPVNDFHDDFLLRSHKHSQHLPILRGHDLSRTPIFTHIHLKLFISIWSYRTV